MRFIFIDIMHSREKLYNYKQNACGGCFKSTGIHTVENIFLTCETEFLFLSVMENMSLPWTEPAHTGHCK